MCDERSIVHRFTQFLIRQYTCVMIGAAALVCCMYSSHIMYSIHALWALCYLVVGHLERVL